MSDDSDSLSSLISRVEKCTGPDRELDAAVEVATFPVFLSADENMYAKPCRRDDHCAPGHFWYVQRSGMSLRAAEPYTASLDAAVALVERVLPHWPWEVKWAGHRKGYVATVWPCDQSLYPFKLADASTAALALLLATLRALRPIDHTGRDG